MEEAKDWASGTETEFNQKYGSHTPDGTPRSGEGYSHLHQHDELTVGDRLKSELQTALYSILHPFGE